MPPEAGRRTLVFGLGANLGDRLTTLRRAALALSESLENARVSGVYSTPPEGGVKQAGYLNAVVAGEGDATPREALALARRLERGAGRERPYPGAPRTLDVDVLFVGEAVMDTPELRVPHPRWWSRDFVVVPLLDVVPDLEDPETGRVVREVASASGWSRDRFPLVTAPGELLRGDLE